MKVDVPRKLSRDGRVLNEFADPPSLPNRDAAHFTALTGSMLWDAGSSELLMIPANPYEVRHYRTDGSLTRAQISSTGLSPITIDPEHQAPLPSDRALSATMLPSGALAVAILKQTLTTSGEYRQQAHLELLDSEGKVLATNISLAGFGKPFGASKDGTLLLLGSERSARRQYHESRAVAVRQVTVHCGTKPAKGTSFAPVPT